MLIRKSESSFDRLVLKISMITFDVVNNLPSLPAPEPTCPAKYDAATDTAKSQVDEAAQGSAKSKSRFAKGDRRSARQC